MDRVPEEQWTEVCNFVKEAVTTTIQEKKKSKKAKWLSEEAIQKGSKRQRKKEKKCPTDAEFWRTARREKKAFLDKL